MKKLTKQDAIENHRKMWDWIAEESKIQKEKVTKGDYFCALGITVTDDRPELDCYCCEYSSQCGDIKCESCPIEWPGGICDKHNSPYAIWEFTEDYKKAAKLARQIANLPETV